MSKHRRTRNHRKAVIAAIAVVAVGGPTAAIACTNGPATATDDRSHRWQRASDDDRSHRWQRTSDDDRSSKWTQRSTREASRKPGTSPKTPSPTASSPSAPATSPSASAPSAPTASPSPSAPTTSAPSPSPSTSAPSTPTAAPSTSAPTASTTPATDATARVVELVNSERAKVGCAPLKVNEKLTEAAQKHSQDMAAHKNMSHTGSDGSNPGDRIERAGYSWSTYGENVAYGYRTPESVMDGWMTSPGHKRNILNCAFEEIGVGLAQPGSYWTQAFGTAR